MSETKFTKGKWETVDGTFVYALNEAGENSFQFNISGNGARGASLTELEANAHLIASAPELYEALEGLLGVISEKRGLPSYNAVLDARKALAKARGES